jgi:hypothetical protein
MSVPSHTGKDRAYDTTTSAVNSANIVEEIRYRIMIRASDDDTILDGQNFSPIKAQHSAAINCTSKLSNSETKVTEQIDLQIALERSHQQDQMIFYGKIKC